MKKLFEDPAIEVIEIRDTITDELEDPISGSDGEF